MGYFEKRLEELKQKAAKEATQRKEAENQQQEDLKELCNKLNEEEIPVFKSGNYAVITLPEIGYLVISSFLDTEPATCFRLLPKCEYKINCPNIAINLGAVIQMVKDVLDELAMYTFEEKDPSVKVDWTWYNQLKEKAE